MSRSASAATHTSYLIPHASSHFIPNPRLIRLLQKQRADHEGRECDGDRVPEAGVNVSGSCDDCRRDERREAAEPAVADVVRELERGVAALCRERFDEER